MDVFLKIYAKVLDRYDKLMTHLAGHPLRASIGQDSGRRALLMYHSSPLRWSPNDPRFARHESLRQSLQIAELLVEAGYQTDVIDIFDDSFEPSKDYDIFIGHGRPAAGVAPLLNDDCRKICLATGQYGPYANSQVEQRYVGLELRRKTHLPVELPAKITVDDYHCFDEIACFGQQATIKTFAPLNMPTSCFSNYPGSHITALGSGDACHFVYIAASRHILKGLDLLLEVFSENKDRHLHIFGKLTKELKIVFQKELSCQNIHQHGYVKMAGREFNEVCSTASFFILPSASEGMPGAALNAMAAGLIPVISEAVDIDISGCGFRMKECSIAEIRETVEECVQLSAIDLENFSRHAVAVVRNNYTPSHFVQAWQKIIKNKWRFLQNQRISVLRTDTTSEFMQIH